MKLIDMTWTKASSLIFLALGAGIMPRRAQVTGNVLARVFQVRFQGKLGTAFVVDYEGRLYLVTANHVVENGGDDATIDIHGNADSGWHALEVSILHGKAQGCADVAVLMPQAMQIESAEPIPFPYNYAIGQEAYFLGFPYGLSTSFPNQKLFVPLVKHGYISATVSCRAVYPEAQDEGNLILLDGWNNPGFSGGPVIAPDVFSPNRLLKIVGIISGYRNERISLYRDGAPSSSEWVAANIGIVIVIPIERAIELIRRQKLMVPDATVGNPGE
jgi:S1-C subfamily serine protease